MALQFASRIMRHLVNHDYILLERAAGGGRFAAAAIRPRLRELGAVKLTEPPSIAEAGWKIVLDDGNGVTWLCLPLWVSGTKTDIVILVSAHPDRYGHDLVIEDIAHGLCTNLTDVPLADINAELAGWEIARLQRLADAEQRLLDLLNQPGPRLPTGVHELAESVLRRLVDGDYEELAREGGELTADADRLREVVAELEDLIIMPPQGLPRFSPRWRSSSPAVHSPCYRCRSRGCWSVGPPKASGSV